MHISPSSLIHLLLPLSLPGLVAGAPLHLHLRRRRQPHLARRDRPQELQARVTKNNSEEKKNAQNVWFFLRILRTGEFASMGQLRYFLAIFFLTWQIFIKRKVFFFWKVYQAGSELQTFARIFRYSILKKKEYLVEFLWNFAREGLKNRQKSLKNRHEKLEKSRKKKHSFIQLAVFGE